jgi:hypothetical protein
LNLGFGCYRRLQILTLPARLFFVFENYSDVVSWWLLHEDKMGLPFPAGSLIRDAAINIAVFVFFVKNNAGLFQNFQGFPHHKMRTGHQ